LKIKRARSDTVKCTAASGWSAAFDSLVTITNQSLAINTQDWITFSGATTQTGGTWGILFDCPAFTGEDYGSIYPNSHNIQLRWVQFQGAGHVTYIGDSRGISLSAAGTASDITFFSVKINKFTTAVFINGPDNITFDRLDMSDCSALNSASWHPNGIWSSGCTNLTVKNSRFYKGTDGFGCGEGIFSEQGGGNSDWLIYGNRFVDLDNTGEKAIEITSATPNLFVYNNTFVNVIGGTITLSDIPSSTGGMQKNNFLYNTNLQTGLSGMTSSNNVTATDTTRFTNYATRDLHIVSTIGAGYARDAGVALGSPYDIDPDLVTRGVDGTWDCGAYEYA
jgi:hypothetical protein